MNFLNRKLRRDIFRHWTQFFSVFLMAFLSVLVYTGLEGVWYGMDTSLKNYMNSSHLADAWIQSTGFSDEDLAEIDAVKGVEATSLKTRFQVTAMKEDEKEGYLILETPGNQDISKLVILSGGKLEQTTRGLYINQDYAEAHHLDLGDTVDVVFADQNVTLKIVGIVLSPDRMYFTGTREFVAPNPELYGYGVITEKTLEEAFAYPGLPNLLELKTNDQTIQKEAPEILGEKYIAYNNRNTLFDVSNALDRVGQIQNLSVLFSLIFILLSILAMYTTIRRLIETQIKDIATLKALGYSNRSMGWHYSSYGLFIGGIGAVLGLLVAPLVSLFVLETQKGMFSLPKWQISYTMTAVGVAVLVTAICTLSAFFASKEARQGLPAQFLRGTIVKRTRTVFLEKIQLIWQRFDFGTKWTWRDSMSNPVRVLMGIIGVSGCMMLLMAGFGMRDSMYAQVDESYGKDFTYTARIAVSSLNTPEENQQLQEELEGQWVQTLPTSTEPTDGYDRVLTIISPGDYVAIRTKDGKKIEDGGVYITEGFADATQLKKGDKVKFRVSKDIEQREFTVAGILVSSTPQGAYVMQETWEQAGGSFTPQEMLLGKKRTEKELKTDDRIREVTMLTEQRENAVGLVQSLESIFLLIQCFAVLLAVVILYNLGALSFTERTRDYATLRVLGYHRNEIRLLAMRENIMTTLIGWLVGLPLGYWFLGEYVGTFSTYQIIYYPSIKTISLILASCIAIGCSLLTTFLIGQRIKKLDMIEATKGIE